MKPPSFYAEGAERREKVDQLFRSIAARYDLVNDLQSAGFHRWWKMRLRQLAAVHPGEQVLDAGCGTGDLALGLARDGAEVVALDATGPMLARARERYFHQRPELEGKISFLQADATRLPCASGRFDLVVAGYLLRNLPSWEAGVCEMHRVLRPGGRLLVLEFGKPTEPLWRACYFHYLQMLVPLFGRLFFGNPRTYAYILESLSHYPEAGRISEGMQRVGFTTVELHRFFGGAMTLHHAHKPGPVGVVAGFPQRLNPAEPAAVKATMPNRTTTQTMGPFPEIGFFPATA